MTIELAPQIEELNREMVRSGKYRSTQDVVTESLQSLDAGDRLNDSKLQSPLVKNKPNAAKWFHGPPNR